MTTQIIGVREFRQNLTSLYKKAQKNQLRYVVMNKNHPVFEVLPFKPSEEVYLESYVKDVARGKQDFKEEKFSSWEDVKKRLDK